MKSQYMLALSVLAVIAVSGCVGFENLGFDLGFFESTKPQTLEAPPDIIEVQNLNVIPSSVPAGSDFTVSFEVKHTGDPKESSDVKAVDVCLYNWGVCDVEKVGSEAAKIANMMYPGWVGGIAQQICSPADFIHAPDTGGEYKEYSYDYIKNTLLQAGYTEENVVLRVYSKKPVSVERYGGSTEPSPRNAKEIVEGWLQGWELTRDTTCSKELGIYYRVRYPAVLVQIKDGKEQVVPGATDGLTNYKDYTPSKETGTSRCGSLVKTFFPQQVEFVEWSLKAPNNEQIANMRATCPVSFKVNYKFTAKSQVDINVISEDKLRDLQRAGQSAAVTPVQTIGIGPIKIYFEFSQAQPFKTGSTILMLISVQDKGSGLLEGNKINEIKLESSNPNEMPIQGKCSPVKDINMVRKKSQQIRCTMKMPSAADVPQSKTYYITASIDYSYALDSKTEVPITPTEG